LSTFVNARHLFVSTIGDPEIVKVVRTAAISALSLALLATCRVGGLSAQQLELASALTPVTTDACPTSDLCAPNLLDELLPSPGTALMSGLMLPGMGYFYTDRPALGALVLGAAGASAGLGLFYRKVEFKCLAPQIDGACARGDLARVETRPLLVPGLAVAGAVTIIGAINAYRSAKRNRFQASLMREAERLNALVPRLSLQGESTAFRVEPTVRGWNGGLRAEFSHRF
jgi:hypothetical protein